MTAFNVTKTVTIGGLEYKLSRLNVAKSREVLAIVQKILGGFEVDNDISPLFMAGLAGALTEAETTKLVTLFGPTTAVDLNDGVGNQPSRVVILSATAAQDELWSGQLELMIEWLEECIKFNFGGVIAKTHAVVRVLNARQAAAKAEADATE